MAREAVSTIDTNLKDGDRRTVTVLFTDLVDFTRLSSHTDPEELDQLISGLFSRFESIVRRHDGSVEKYIGDAMVAVFGVPRIHEDDAVRAVNAAFEFQDAVESLNHRYGQRQKSEDDKDNGIKFRTGIHTGLITTGKRGEFDVVTGHTMNLAARIQQAAPPGEIYVSASTREECGRDYVFTTEVKVDAKGVPEPVSAYELCSRNTLYLNPDAIFVGRDQMIDELLRSYLRHTGYESPGYLITGNAGIGKTALIRKFVEKIRRFPDFKSPVLWARARKFRNLPFAVISDLIINYTGLDPRWDEDRTREALVKVLGVDTQTAAKFSHLLRESLKGLPEDHSAFATISEILRKILAKSKDGTYPAIIFVDNSNLMDRQSADFFSWFVRSSQTGGQTNGVQGGGPLPFMIFAEREPRVELSSSIPGLHSCEVPPLSSGESRQLFEKLWNEGLAGTDGSKPNPPAEAEIVSILNNAEGNPLFIHAYARFVRQESSRKEVTREERADVPQSVQAVFLSTISSYNDDIRDLLKKLSVFQHSFSTDDAYFIQTRTDGDPAIVEPALDFYEQEEIIYRERGQYYFRHDILKKALYNSLLNYNKKILHQLVVELMRKQSNPHPIRLVHHLIRSENYSAANDLLLDTSASTKELEFMRYFDVLLDLPEYSKGKPRLGLLFLKAALFFNNGMTKQADKILSELLQRAFADTDVDYASSAYHLLTGFNAQSFRFQKALFCGTKALSYYEKIPGTERRMANVLVLLIINASYCNDSAAATDFLNRLSDLAEKNADLNEFVWDARISRALLTGSYREADRIIRNANMAALRLQHEAWHSTIATGTLAEAQESIQAYLDSGSKMYSALSEAYAVLAMVNRFMNKNANVDGYLDQAEFFSVRTQNDFDYLESLSYLAEANFVLGHLEAAEAKALEGITLAQRHSAYYAGFKMLVVLVQIYLRKDQRGKAEFFLQEAAQIESMGPLVLRSYRLVYHALRAALFDDEKSKRIARELNVVELEETNVEGGMLHILRAHGVDSEGRISIGQLAPSPAKSL